MGIMDQTVDRLPSPEAKNWPSPLLTPANGGHDVDLRRMAAGGVTLLGRLQSVSGTRLIIAPDLKESLAKGDVWFTDYKKSVDDYVTKTGMNVPEDRHSDEGVAEPDEVSRPLLEDLRLRDDRREARFRGPDIGCTEDDRVVLRLPRYRLPKAIPRRRIKPLQISLP